MRIAAISDIHGNLGALRAVLSDIARQGADVTVNLGDILSGPLQPRETADLLLEQGLPSIAGNHERQLLARLDRDGEQQELATSDGFAAAAIAPAHAAWLRSLPSSLKIEDVTLVHGTPRSDLEYWLETVTDDHGAAGSKGLRAATPEEARSRMCGAAGSALLLCGHTHVPRAMTLDGVLIVNPGSVGLQAYRDIHPWPHDVETGSPEARYAVLTRRAGVWSCELRAVAYDWSAQASVAASRNRMDWIRPLEAGRNS